MNAFAADIGDVKHRVTRQLPLYTEAPLQHPRLKIVRVECVRVDDAGGTEDTERIGETDRVRVGDNSVSRGVGECHAPGKRWIQVQDGVIVELVNVVINACARANYGLLRQAVSQPEPRLEELLVWSIESVRGTDVRNQCGIAVFDVRETQAAPQAADIGSGGIVLIAQ